jgi:hypothetical protein
MYTSESEYTALAIETLCFCPDSKHNQIHYFLMCSSKLKHHAPVLEKYKGINAL